MCCCDGSDDVASAPSHDRAIEAATVTELPRIVGLVHEHRPKPAAAPTVTELPRIEGRVALPALALAPSVDELSVDAELRARRCCSAY